MPIVRVPAVRVFIDAGSHVAEAEADADDGADEAVSSTGAPHAVSAATADPARATANRRTGSWATTCAILRFRGRRRLGRPVASAQCNAAARITSMAARGAVGDRPGLRTRSRGHDTLSDRADRQRVVTSRRSQGGAQPSEAG